MSLSAGTRLGPYKIVALLGAGGMGEVYRALDTKLDRDVAIKILPEQFVSDPERVARFQREAKTLASLNHPHIGGIYGLEDAEGVRALVLELVEGPTLADRIAGGPIPLDEALPIAKQIADALEAAHEQGIVHRDLKPANIKLRSDGTVKVLDFGLAKALQPASGISTTVAASPTITSPAMTRMGVVLGTAAYMSPEQARGQSVDKRTDIWAFGCVLYEMLTGRAAFARATVSDTIAAVLDRDPAWQALPPDTTPVIRRLIERCVDKDRMKRRRDIGDIRNELDEAMSRPVAEPQSAIPSRARTPRFATLGAAAILLGALAAAVALRSGNRVTIAPSAVGRFTIPLIEGEALATGQVPLAISPDGQYVAFETARSGNRRLYLRSLAGLEPRLVSENSDGNPFFSPDSQWLGYFADGKLKKVSVKGGPSTALADAPSARGASWGEDGFIVFSAGSRAGLSRLSADGGAPQELTVLDAARGETSHRRPSLLPGGRSVVYRAEGSTYADGAIVVYSLDAHQQATLIADGGGSPSFSPTGHLLYTQEGNLMAIPFDLTGLHVTGPPVQVLEGVQYYSLSRAGLLVYSAAPQVRTALAWVDRRGRSVTLLPPAPRNILHPRLTHDNSRVVMQIQTGPDRNIWTYDIARDVLTKLTFDGSNLWPTVTPDGTRVVYASNRPGTTWDIYSKPVDGSGAETPLVVQPLMQIPRAISRDGDWLAYSETRVETGEDLWLLPLRNEATSRPFASTHAREQQPAFSPDARWLAYVSNESGHDEVYVRPMVGDAGKWQISYGGGVEPLWSPNGREIFFRDDEKTYSVNVTIGPGVAFRTPKVLFEGRYILSAVGSQNYDVSVDGRFLMVSSGTADATAPLNVVTNWLQELDRLVPIPSR